MWNGCYTEDQTKGLAEDGVIIVNFDDNTDDLVKYIMATRALHQLKIINYKGK